MQISLAQTSSPGAPMFCPSLEAVKFTESFCVPSSRALCHSGQPGNCERLKRTEKCLFVAEPGAYKEKQEHPGNCSAYEQIPLEPGDIPEVPGQSYKNGDCLRYQAPSCSTLCTPCVHKMIEEDRLINGCAKLCDEKTCEDEYRCDAPPPDDPVGHRQKNSVCGGTIVQGGITYIGPLNPTIPKCPASESTCRGKTFTLPPMAEGGECFCDLGRPCIDKGGGNYSCPGWDNEPDCTPQPITPAPIGNTNQSCPWIEYDAERGPNEEGVCKPIPVGNRFPQDCCECSPTLPSGVSCKSCGIETSRCGRP